MVAMHYVKVILTSYNDNKVIMTTMSCDVFVIQRIIPRKLNGSATELVTNTTTTEMKHISSVNYSFIQTEK